MSTPLTSGLSVEVLLRVIDVKYGCFTLLYFTLLYFTLLYFTLLYFTLRYDSCICAIGCSSLSTNDDRRSAGPSHPDMIGPPTNVGL